MLKKEQKRTLDSQRRFLEAYCRTGLVCESCRQAGISYQTHYRWLADDPEYRRHIEDAKRAVCVLVDDEIINRAVHGIEEPIVYQGEIQYKLDANGKRTDRPVTIRRYSDTLLIFAAKALMPEKYRDNYKLDVTSNVTVPRQDPELSRLTDEELDTLKALLEKAEGRGPGPGPVM
jgi:hypothetical protein